MHRYKVIITLFLVHVILSAQVEHKTPVTSKAAFDTFRQGDYAQAFEMYSYLLSKYPKNSKFNYYLGICELKTNSHISDAVKHLKYASVRGVSKDVYYYLGRAYQLNYNFKEAIASFDKFFKYFKEDDVRYDKAVMYKKEAEEGLKRSAKIYYLKVLSKDTVSKDRFLSLYHPVKDAGYILRNKDFFESGVDPEGILYLTERKDEVYFSMPVDNTNNSDIFKMEKLIDGWSKPVNLDSINSKYDDLYPYLQIDGVTLYFSSNREGGLGGYDIYKTIYDPETKSFSKPVNMGIPFNSPRDDYFFVTDEFTGVAWFTSNRRTYGDKVEVYQIIWNKSVVKDMVYEQKDIKIEATMPLLKDIPEKFKQLKEKQYSTNKTKITKGLFSFKVTDEVTYINFNQFQSKEALEIFKEGYALQQKKDSLSLLMKRKRKEYSAANDPKEKEKLVNEILTVEKQVYGLDSKINDYYYSARSIEKPIVERLIKLGKYNPQNSDLSEEPEEELDEYLIPKEYSYYTDEEFSKKLQMLDDMYKKLFSPETVNKLKHTDSLFVWGNILSLEASKLLEQAARTRPQTNVVISSVFSKDSGENMQEDETAELSRKGQDLKNLALKLYHQSLDIKYEIFKDKIKEIIISQPTVDLTFLEEKQVAANAYYRQAMEDTGKSITFNPEQYEKEGTLKREAVKLQEEALFMYLNYIETGSAVIDTLSDKNSTGGNAVKSHLQDQGSGNSVAETAATGHKAARHTAKDLEYRIQVGVFKNEPNSASLSKIQPISAKPVPGKQLTKYFSGHYSTYQEAEKYLVNVREAGFSGAFIVAFYNNEQISLLKAKQLGQ